MTQRDLNRALARATGESVRTIDGYGFSLVDLDTPQDELEISDLGPQVVDWDRIEAERWATAIHA
jgi:hypothetical protein